MAATVMTSPQRQPFACLGGTRLRSLGNVKNRQNAFPTQLAAPTKRRAPEPSFDDIDQENFDPELVTTIANKKAKNFDFNALKPSKSSQFVLTKAASSPAATGRAILTPKRLQNNTKPIVNAARSTPLAIKTSQPYSAPAALAESGRKSPKSKRAGILNRRRVSSSPTTRVNPPSYGLSNGLPFSIAAALTNTVGAHEPAPVADVVAPAATNDESIPKSWQFDIYEDTPEEYAGTMMQHSTSILDISDDESRFSPARSDRGKENIPPADVSSSYAVSRRDMMTDEPRTPLGDLETSEYYAEGCDANSFVIVPGDQDVSCGATTATPETSTSLTSSASESTNSAQEGWKEILEKLSADKRVKAEVEKLAAEARGADIEIWESESAKAEDESGEKMVKTFEWVSPLGSPKAGSEVDGDENAMPL